MTKLLVIVSVIALAASASATDSRLGQPDRPRPDFNFNPSALPVAEVLICLDTDANPGFADLTPIYEAAFEAAGAAPIATCAVEVSSGAINFPPNLTAANYPVVVVLTSENWWSTPQNIDPVDEATLASYLDTGGNLLMVGQDYMYGAHPTMGTCSGFPRDYLGLDYCYQDVEYGVNTANISGSVGWIFEGESALLESTGLFLSNPFFPDCADPMPTAGYAFRYDDAGQDGIAVYNETEIFRTVWSGVELAGAESSVFDDMIQRIYQWFVGTTPVERSSWARIKSMYQ
ncbi:MAG: hypothetical protein JXB46_04825 [Candidatus Eisenbacteria bacterium]|nr:hypothetical protein [Candidatus Eisenbacteria bacterium]